MLIAQISDLHCGFMFRKEKLREAIKEINELSPDVVLITGDLTENGIPSKFEIATKESKKLTAEKIIYVSRKNICKTENRQ